MVMNPSLSFADWHKQRNLDTGMVGFFLNDPTQPENPLLTTVVPRIVTLNAGQTIFRWVHSGTGGSPLEKAAGPWWSTKRGAQAILRDAKGGDTSGHARAFSNIARSWGSDLGTVVCATVTGAIKCFLGVGRAIYDEPNREVWDSGGHQLYIPNMSEKGPTGWTLSKEARANLRVDWVKPAGALSMSDWEAARAGRPVPRGSSCPDRRAPARARRAGSAWRWRSVPPQLPRAAGASHRAPRRARRRVQFRSRLRPRLPQARGAPRRRRGRSRPRSRSSWTRRPPCSPSRRRAPIPRGAPGRSR